MINNITPVLLITGYLGSGKTTLLNRILANNEGIKFAVIVNDIGEVNIDAELIQRGGIVGQDGDDNLVPLQNGCICCTLKTDLVEQLSGLVAQRRFDYIVIEASGICEPAPIAQTIAAYPQLYPQFAKNGIARLDSIVTVVDALRLKDEFNYGDELTQNHDHDDDNLASLVVEQVEFCNKILLNKISEVSEEEAGRITSILRELQPHADITPCDFCDVPVKSLLNTADFDFEKVATSARWIEVIEGHADEDEDAHAHEHRHGHDDEHEHDGHEHGHDGHEHEYDGHEHGHDGYEHEYDGHEHEHDGHEHEHDHEHKHGEHCHCHHCHHNDKGEALEYGISTFVWYRRQPLDMNKFDFIVSKKWPAGIIRCKGVCYFDDDKDTCYLFEQAGKQISMRNAGQWYATMPAEELADFLEKNPGVKRDWHDTYGDRMQKLVFIGQHIDREAITKDLDFCLADE